MQSQSAFAAVFQLGSVGSALAVYPFSRVCCNSVTAVSPYRSSQSRPEQHSLGSCRQYTKVLPHDMPEPQENSFYRHVAFTPWKQLFFFVSFSTAWPSISFTDQAGQRWQRWGKANSSCLHLLWVPIVTYSVQKEHLAPFWERVQESTVVYISIQVIND